MKCVACGEKIHYYENEWGRPICRKCGVRND